MFNKKSKTVLLALQDVMIYEGYNFCIVYGAKDPLKHW